MLSLDEINIFRLVSAIGRPQEYIFYYVYVYVILFDVILSACQLLSHTRLVGDVQI